MSHLAAVTALTVAALAFLASTTVSPPWDIGAALAAAVAMAVALLLFAVRRALRQ